MAEGTSKSGLNDMIGQQLAKLDSLPQVGLLFIILILISVLTQIASNAATASMLLPIILDLAIKLNVKFIFCIFKYFLFSSFSITPSNDQLRAWY